MEIEMKDYIRAKSRLITFSFVALWVLMLCIALLFELDVFPSGILMQGDLTLYYLQSVGILLALILIPVSLKLFHVRLQKIKLLPLQQAVNGYFFLSLARIAALMVPAVFNLLLYYFSLNTAPAFVALITMMATIFCLPGERRMHDELDLNED